MMQQLDTESTTDSPGLLAYGIVFTALLAVQIGMLNVAFAQPETPVVVSG